MWPKLKVVSKTKHSKTKTEVRSTQISKTKHPKLENEAPKSRKRSTQNSKTKHLNLENEAPIETSKVVFVTGISLTILTLKLFNSPMF